MISLVLLLSEPRPMTPGGLAVTIREALGIDVWTGVDEPRGDYYILGEGDPAYIVQLGERTYLVNNFPVPYVKDPGEAASAIRELRLRHAIAEHAAWLSVDLLRGDDAMSAEDAADEAYRTIGPLVAALADEDDTLALLEPATGRLNLYGEALLDALRGDDPRRAFDHPSRVPIVAIKDDDPRMLAAVAEARDRWPEFVAAFEGRSDEEGFSAKVRLAEGESVEFIWVSVTAIEGDYLFGTLDNDPIYLQRVRHGSRVRAQLDSLNDWVISGPDKGGPIRGGFTIDVLRRAQEEPEPEG